MNAIELLEKARDRIMNGWTQGWFARDSAGKRVEIEDENASCYCLSGSLFDKDTLPTELVKARMLLNSALPRQYDNIVQFNDDRHTQKEDVINLLDKAIESGKVG
jgi:hypothetical protein